MRRETSEHMHRCRCGESWHCTQKYCVPHPSDECIACSRDAQAEWIDQQDPQPELPQLAAKEF